jgi:hypothetical protein
VKSEQGHAAAEGSSSSSSSGASNSQEAKREPGVKSEYQDVVEFVETASGLVLPKRCKREP